MEDLLDEIYQYLERPQRYERYIACRCMWHDDSRPSLFIYQDSYKCSACGAFGKTSKLLETLRLKHGTFIKKKEKSWRSPWSSWEDRYGDLNHTINQAHKNLTDHNKTAYLYKRGLDIQTIKELKIGWLDDWITFPVLNCTGQLIGGIARAGETNKSEAKYCNTPQLPPETLFVPSWERVKYSSKLLLVYGIIDAISLYQLGYASASTVTGKRIDPCAFDDIRKEIYIIPDQGEEVDAALLSARLSWRGHAMKIDWLDGMKDVNDAFVNNRNWLEAILGDIRGDNITISKRDRGGIGNFKQT